ncbi:protein hairless [Rhopalosiphum maidis]|uniref:protein hairless n=1 Tax=Rhopalosiphum maidis TaxID=43146 RepID=UPI000EFDD83E|nr:protein hairless [Rhopalosiphum maidis]
MTRDSAAVAALDDRRRRCPISAASNVVDDASTLMTNSTTTSGSSSNDDVGGGDEGGSLKSSSEVSTTTSCCGGSSSSSRSGSDDDDSATVTRLSTAIDDSCTTTIKTPTIPPSLPKQMEDDNNGDKDSSSSSHNDEAAVSTTPTSIGGRLTFYKDGKFIFQLAAHHQQNPYNNPSALTSPCRWVPVPTVIQQHKNNVKCIGEWSQYQQNKTIWPYLVTNTASDSKSPQPVQQSQPPTVRIGERKQHQFQHRTTPPPLSLITNAVNTATHAGGIVVATTTNIVRRPSRKCSTTVAVENVTDFQHQHCQPPTQLRGLPRRSQQHQHQAFMMMATDTIKVQRRLLSLPKKERLWCQRKRKSMTKNSILQELKPPKINLECVVRNLWCRRHTTELLLRRQLSINNNGDTMTAAISAVVDIIPPIVSRHITVSSASVVDSTCSNTGGGSKRRSMVSPSPTTATPIPVTATTITLSNKSGNSSPHKKYKLGNHHPPEQILLPQQRLVVDKNVKKTIPQPPMQTMSTNDHSITAILSGGATGAKRSNGSGALSMVIDPENCVITTPTSTSTILSPHKNLNTPSPAPLSLLRTLLKSPSSESGSPPIAANINGVGYRHHTNGSRKRPSAESTVVSSLPPINAAAVKVDNGLGTSAMAIPSVCANSADNASAVLTALHQLPTIHHPAAGQLAAAGYFNVLYHQAAMAAAMAYQTHAQLPQTLPKSQPSPLLSSQFPTTGGANSTWQRQLNRQPPLLHPSEAIVGSGVTNATISSSASTVVAPYSSPLITATVNGSSLLPPATPSPPPSLMLHPHPVHSRNLLLHHQQQYQPAPTVQQQLSSFHRQQGSSVKKRTGVIGATEYGGCIEENNSGVVATLDEESSSADCMPLNLSKDSIAENVSGTSPTARVR